MMGLSPERTGAELRNGEALMKTQITRLGLAAAALVALLVAGGAGFNAR